MDYGYIQKERNKARELKQSRWWINQKAKGKCYYCQNITPPSKLTMDHKVPVSRGGKSTRKNVVPCCEECNRQKQYFTSVEWEYSSEK